MKHLNIALAGLLALLAINTAFAGDPTAGKEKSAACAACHGADGNAPTANFPRLAGQYEDYLLQALKEYRSGARTNPIMVAQVAALSDADMENLAAYFAEQKGLIAIDIE
ncbi:MAG: cytochrome c [Gammaproteobacteria bacterium]|jgi:cytochrome c553|nr:cytochrome c [Gammaproteobacteria bacterium]